jgi:threonine aldolase
MYSFKNDYAEGAHPNILQRLIASNLEQHPGYGEDDYSVKAKQLIRQQIARENSGVYFVTGGTQANRLVITAFLRPHEAVISARTGHIFVHEAGAIEASGHKVITVESPDGKLTPASVEEVLQQHALAPHMVKPKLVYISNSTEIGTIYTKQDLTALSECCRKHQLYLFMDGARLGSALAAAGSDLTLADVAHLTDAFYIGATKNGGLLGEAIVINNPQLDVDFPYILKQNGALLAKGRLLGIQFFELFQNDLYLSLARHANTAAARISDHVRSKGYDLLIASPTNQIFPIFPNTLIEALGSQFQFYPWKKIDDQHTALRLITSWTTEDSMVDAFIAAIH